MSKLGAELKKVIDAYQVTFSDADRRSSSLLEIAAMLLAVQHYEANDYDVIPFSKKGNFSPKYAATGDTMEYSYWKVKKGDQCYEIHLNAPIWDGFTGKESTFVVDVGVIKEGSKIRKDDGKGIHTFVSRSRRYVLIGYENEDLVTFIEAKYIPIYPMLVAQFVGIVHEITPWAIGNSPPEGFRESSHFDPTLVSKGKPSANVERLLSKMPKRNFSIRIIPSFEKYIEGMQLRIKPKASILNHDPKNIFPKEWWLK